MKTAAWDEDLEKAWDALDQHEAGDRLRPLLNELWESRCCLRALVQEYRTPYQVDPDEMEEIVDKAEELTGYSYDPEKDHREDDYEGEQDG